MIAHPEDEHLASAGPREVTIYTRQGCSLCEEAKEAIAPILHEFGAKLRQIDVDQDAVLRERYREVPVVFVGARKAAKYRVNVEQFRRHLRDAIAASTPWPTDTKSGFSTHDDEIRTDSGAGSESQPQTKRD